uniref:Putative transmembrane ascorbate ferrireductase 2 n=1 Tax=Anthurium amnicola TaxID=1678845 RepID=A0A1D1YFQ4_9ARAE
MREETLAAETASSHIDRVLLSPLLVISPIPSSPQEQQEAAVENLPRLPSSSLLPLSLEMAAAPVVRFPIVLLIRLMGVAAAAMVISWAVHFRGGMSLFSDNQDLIFNVHPVLMVIGFILLYGEGIDFFPLSHDGYW